MGADLFTCSCGRLQKSLYTSSHRDALRVFRGDMDMNAELVADDKTVRIKGPVRSRHEGTLYEFDRETGEVLRTTDLRPKPRR